MAIAIGSYTESGEVVFGSNLIYVGRDRRLLETIADPGQWSLIFLFWLDRLQGWS